MVTRRTFLTAGAGLVFPTLGMLTEPAFPTACLSPNETRGARKTGPNRMAVVTTEWRYHSHAWHMAERFLAGYPIDGKWHRPELEVVSAYVDQVPEGDLS